MAHGEMPDLSRPHKTSHLIKLPTGRFLMLRGGFGVSGYARDWAYLGKTLERLLPIEIMNDDWNNGRTLTFQHGHLRIPWKFTDERPVTWTDRGSPDALPAAVLDLNDYVIDDHGDHAVATEL